MSEAPESFLIWSGLFCISSVLKRKVKFSREWTKHYEIWPTTYLIFVGPPGVARKSTSAKYVEKLLLRLNSEIILVHPAHVNFGPTSGSAAALVKEMSETIDGSMTVIAGEFGNIVRVLPAETYDFFTKMFDNDATYKHSTIGRGLEAVLNPSLNLFGCTTPDWIEQNQGYMLGGGFAARTIFVFEERARQYRLFYKDVGRPLDELEKVEEDLTYDLKIIGDIQGEFKPENKELADDMEAWYQDYMPRPVDKGAETFKARKHIHTIRTAGLLSLCERNDLIITKEHWAGALELIRDVEKKLSRGLASVGRNPYASVLYEVLDFIDLHGPVKRGKILKNFFNDVGPEDVIRILEVLSTSGEIEFIVNDSTYRRARR